MIVATRKITSRQTPEGQGHEKLGANRFGVATQGISVATITRLLKEIYVATSTKYVATQIKNKPREKVATEKREATTEEATKTGGSFTIKKPNWARILGILNAINEVRPNSGKPINTRF